MQISSQIVHNKQTILPDQVLEALRLREGDEIVFEIDQTGVHLRKAPPIDTSFTDALKDTLNEWDSVADDEAYADL